MGKFPSWGELEVWIFLEVNTSLNNACNQPCYGSIILSEIKRAFQTKSPQS